MCYSFSSEGMFFSLKNLPKIQNPYIRQVEKKSFNVQICRQNGEIYCQSRKSYETIFNKTVLNTFLPNWIA